MLKYLRIHQMAEKVINHPAYFLQAQSPHVKRGKGAWIYRNKPVSLRKSETSIQTYLGHIGTHTKKKTLLSRHDHEASPSRGVVPYWPLPWRLYSHRQSADNWGMHGLYERMGLSLQERHQASPLKVLSPSGLVRAPAHHPQNLGDLIRGSSPLPCVLRNTPMYPLSRSQLLHPDLGAAAGRGRGVDGWWSPNVPSAPAHPASSFLHLWRGETEGTRGGGNFIYVYSEQI